MPARIFGMIAGKITLLMVVDLLAPYANLSALSFQNDRKLIRMMYNENQYGPSRIAKIAMQKAFDESNL